VCAPALKGLRGTEDAVNECRFAVVNVGYDGHITDMFDSFNQFNYPCRSVWEKRISSQKNAAENPFPIEKGDLCLAIPGFVGKRKRTFREEFTGDFI